MIQDKAYLDYVEKMEGEKSATTLSKLAWATIIISALSLLVSLIQVF